MKTSQVLKVSALCAALVLSTLTTDAMARDAVRHGNVGGSKHNVGSTNRNGSRDVNRNTNRNTNVNVNVNNRGGYYDNNHRWHPVATAAAVTATAIVVGSIVNTVPSGCVTNFYNGVAYRQCGNTWYQPRGNQYIIVNQPW